MEKMGFGPRLGAALIDVVIIVIAMAILGPMFGAGMIGFAASGNVAGSMFGLIVMALIPLAYTSTEVFMAGTPGKKILKMTICNADGTIAPQEVLLKRWAIKNSSSVLRVLAVVTGVGIIGTLGTIAGLIIFVGCFLTLSADKLALHDKVAMTAVYKTTVAAA